MQTLEIDITNADTAHVVSTGDTVVIGDHDTIYTAVGHYAINVAQELDHGVPVTVSDSEGRQRSMTVYPDGNVDIATPGRSAGSQPESPAPSRDETVDGDDGPVRVPTRIPTSRAPAEPAPAKPADQPPTPRPAPSLDDTHVMHSIAAEPESDGSAAQWASHERDQHWRDQSPAGYVDDRGGYRGPAGAGGSGTGSRFGATAKTRRGVGPHVPKPARGTQWWRSHRAALAAIVAAVLVVVVAGAVGLGMLVGHSSESSTPPDPAAVLAPTADPTSDAVECPSRTDGAVTTGRGPGDQTSGPNVIRAFEYAYFRWRSGAAARALAVPDVKTVGSAADLQLGISALNPQARYCLSITDKGNSLYRVEITLILPDGTRDPKPAVQDITTTVLGDRTFISAIKQNP